MRLYENFPSRIEKCRRRRSKNTVQSRANPEFLNFSPRYPNPFLLFLGPVLARKTAPGEDCNTPNHSPEDPRSNLGDPRNPQQPWEDVTPYPEIPPSEPTPIYKKRPVLENHEDRSLKRRLPTLPRDNRSTIGAGELNFSVRNGKRWSLTAITTLKVLLLSIKRSCRAFRPLHSVYVSPIRGNGSCG